MARTLELTWIAKLRQWRKRRFIKGKRKDFYLGTGNGKDDRQSYERALDKWKTKEADSTPQTRQTRLRRHITFGEKLFPPERCDLSVSRAVLRMRTSEFDSRFW